MQLKKIEDIELYYLEKYASILVGNQREIIKGLDTKKDILDDWIGRYGGKDQETSLFDKGAVTKLIPELDEDFLIAKEIEDLQVNTGATTPVFLNEEERRSSITITGNSVNVVSRSVTSDTSTNVTVIGLDTGATFNIAVTVKADPSKL